MTRLVDRSGYRLAYMAHQGVDDQAVVRPAAHHWVESC